MNTTSDDLAAWVAIPLADYRALQKVCHGAPYGSVLAEALDAGAGMLAMHIAQATDHLGLTDQLFPALFDERQGMLSFVDRDSTHIDRIVREFASATPVAIRNRTVADLLLAAMADDRPRLPNPPDPTLADAEQDYATLVRFTGTSNPERIDEVLPHAHDQALFVLDQIRAKAAKGRAV